MNTEYKGRLLFYRFIFFVDSTIVTDYYWAKNYAFQQNPRWDRTYLTNLCIRALKSSYKKKNV